MVRGRPTSRPFLGLEAYRITKLLSEAIGARVAGSDKERAAAEFICHSFRSMGYTASFQRFEAPAGRESQNVLATRVDALPESFLVVGAHYDTVKDTPGANDNASGVGVLMETAIVLAGIELPVSVVFAAFGSEEGSHAGSKHLVSSLGSPSVVAGMINLDAVGAEAGMEIGCYGGGDPWLANHCRATADSLGHSLSESNFGGKSDYASFAEAGIAVACIARTDQPYAHTPDDDMSRISREGMAAIGAVLVAALTNLPGLPQKRGQSDR